MSRQRKSRHRQLGWHIYAAFSGVVATEDNAEQSTVTEQSINDPGASLAISDVVIVCDKLDTGYNEPLLACMYIDRVLRSSSQTVQLLSRLNRRHPRMFVDIERSVWTRVLVGDCHSCQLFSCREIVRSDRGLCESRGKHPPELRGLLGRSPGAGLERRCRHRFDDYGRRDREPSFVRRVAAAG